MRRISIFVLIGLMAIYISSSSATFAKEDEGGVVSKGDTPLSEATKSTSTLNSTPSSKATTSSNQKNDISPPISALNPALSQKEEQNNFYKNDSLSMNTSKRLLAAAAASTLLGMGVLKINLLIHLLSHMRKPGLIGG